MIPITDNEAAAQAKYDIELALLKSAAWQMFVNDELVTELEPGSYEFSVEWGRLIFAWWDDDHSQSWRVTNFEIGEAEIRLRVSRGLAKEVALITLRDAEGWRARQKQRELPVNERRAGYGETLAQLVASHFAGVRIQRVNTTGNRARLMPVQYARLVIELRRETVLVIGASDGEAQSEIDGVLAAGLVWLAGYNERREAGKQAKRLWLCVPKGRAQTTLERLTLVDARHTGAAVECFEVDEDESALTALRPVTQAELINSHERELLWPQAAETRSRWRERIVNLAPELIEARYDALRDTEIFSINGLEFARVTHASTAQRASFGVAAFRPQQTTPTLPPVKKLTDTNFSELAQLARSIATERQARPADPQHPFHRLRAEAWLESLLRRDIRVLDAALDPRFVYSQIPAWRADERSVLDLLAVNDEGRLVVIEIKAAEDANLPLQGLDYWLRVEQARVRGEFARRGLFPGVPLADRPPLLYLVAPRLRFHRTFKIIARCLAPEIEAYQIGLNSNWRAGVKVHTRERINERSENSAI
ncbi:MAG: hypothetical protein U0Z53_18490 [Blastocatellia bacterium]